MAKSDSAINIPQLDDSNLAWKPVAVIDIGTSLIRMVIAEISPTGEIRRLENLSQPVNLGKDSFTSRYIKKQTIEDCVKVLKSYRALMEQYQITRADQIQTVATSAVREALNQIAFVDRIYIATGIDINILDEAEVNRITYLGVQPLLSSEPKFKEANICLAEIGGGSTELLLVKGEDVRFSNTYRLGALRLRETLEATGSSQSGTKGMLKSQIRQTIDRMLHDIGDLASIQLVALGGDMRFAAHQLYPEWDRESLAPISRKSLEELTEKILSMSEDKLVRKYHMTLNDAETLGAALLAYTELARALKLKTLYVCSLNMRDGMLLEMTANKAWTEAFQDQVIRSAIDMGQKFNFDEKHAVHVADLSRTLFRELADQHQLDSQYELILYIAALLHEIGLFIGTRGYHKHSMYIIQNGTLFGVSEQNLRLIALIARYHRRASPKTTHAGFAGISRDSRIVISKLAAILRLAVALDHSYSQRIQKLSCERVESRLVIHVHGVEDLSLEQIALKEDGRLFEEIFGVPVLLRTKK